jgi:replicative DNA helicase
MIDGYNPKLETRGDLDALFGSDSTARHVERPAPRFTAREMLAAEPELPSADELNDEQFRAAVSRLHEDTTAYPRYPWKELSELAGPMCPEDLIMVAARTGGGKSLFLQNLFDAMICAGRFGLYVGLEQSPEILRIKWACLRSDVAPKLVLATPDGMRGTPTWHTAMDVVQADLKWQRTPEIKVRAHFSATRKINARKLQSWTEWAVDHGCEFVIVDHIDRVQHGDGKNSFHEMSESIRLAKELAVKHRIVMILASQVGRPGDQLEQFMPPSLHDLRGGGTKEEESDTVIGVYRPMRMDVTDQELKAVRQGLKKRDDVIEPHTMGVMLLKHRLDGPQAGKVVKLAVRHQRVFDLAERDRWTTDGYYPRQIV